MNCRIVEIKAYCPDHERVRKLLEDHAAHFVGIDHQVDTYFKTHHGRLKLRKGTIEQALIHYQRSDQAQPKLSEVLLYKAPAKDSLRAVLTAALGILTVVDKQRHIYFIDHVKFHLDEVVGLGRFMEIEAIDDEHKYTEAELRRQCAHYMNLLGISESDLVTCSYSDLLLEKQEL